MNPLATRIAADRRHLERMVDVLAAQVDALRDPGDDPDYRLLRDIARYFSHYPSAVLYPAEDAMFSLLAERDPRYREMSTRLRRHHERHQVLAARLHDRVDAALAGNIVPRDRLLKEAAAYLELQRERMGPADATLLAAADDALSESDVALIEQRIDARVDAATRERIRDEFTRLCEDIETAVDGAG